MGACSEGYWMVAFSACVVSLMIGDRVIPGIILKRSPLVKWGCVK